MTKKVGIWDDILGKKEPTLLKKMVAIIVSQLGVLLFGVTLLVSMLWVSGFLTLPEYEENGMLRMWVVYSMFAIIAVAVSISYVNKRRDNLFFKYSVFPLKIGLGINILVLVSSLGMVLLYQNFTDTSHHNCLPLKDQIPTIQSATVPIETDAGASGTGFAVSDGKTILTAYHVVEGAKDIYANYASGRVSMSLVDTAPDVDLALLSIDEPMSAYLELVDRHEVGDEVYLNGYPGNAFNAGLASLSGGIISRYISNKDIQLNIEDAPVGLDLVQTDTATNPGNSGGALVGKCGVVGIMILVSSSDGYLKQYGIRSEQGISYAVSSRVAAERFDLPIK